MIKKKASPSFFDVFKIGIELEGEFKRNPINYLNNWEVDCDSSINNQNDGYDNELRTGIIKTEEKERIYLEDLRSLIQDADNKYFAYNNPSCGTHIHFSFNDSYILEDKDLYVFDTMDFEKYFFSRYFSRFKLNKFVQRVHNHYASPTLWFRLANTPSKRIISNQGSKVYTAENSIKRKHEKGKHLWLTMYGVHSGMGAELRIFPHIQSVAGLKAVLGFTKKVLLSYLAMKKTQNRLKELKTYREEICKCVIIPSKLNEFEKIVLARLRANGGSLTDEYACGDVRLMLASLYKKRRKAFVRRESSMSSQLEPTELPF